MEVAGNKTRIITSEELNGLSLAAGEIKQGKLVAFATDTVYGVGTNTFDAEAITRLYQVKGRAGHKPIPILVAGPEQLSLLCREVNELARRLIECFWPGALTLVLPRHPDVPGIIGGGSDTIAVRMPGHVLTLALIAEVGFPVATTSANMSGRNSPLDAREVLFNLGGKIDLVLDSGPCPGGVDSSVVDTTGGVLRILRETAIPAREIREALK